MAETSIAGVVLTPTQNKLFNVLKDGQPHTSGELHECLPDELGAPSNVNMHLSNLRKLLRRCNRGILGEVTGGVVYYRLVQYVPAER